MISITVSSSVKIGPKSVHVATALTDDRYIVRGLQQQWVMWHVFQEHTDLVIGIAYSYQKLKEHLEVSLHANL